MECIEEGVVSSIPGPGRAVVKAARSDACSACSAKSTCAAIGGAPSDTEVVVTNELGARPGDRVTVGMESSAIVGAAGLLYFFPAVVLIAGALIGHGIAPTVDLDVNAGAAMGAGVGLAVSLLCVAFIGRRLSKRRTYTPRITKILWTMGQQERSDR